MANKKRVNSYAVKKLRCYKLTRKDVVVLQKILRRYADLCESKKDMISGRVRRLPDGRGVMPRNRMDMHVTVGDLSVDHIGLLPKKIKRTRYLEVNCTPGIKVEFKPLSTKIGSQENYATGVELMAMRRSVAEIIAFLETRKRSFANLISL